MQSNLTADGEAQFKTTGSRTRSMVTPQMAEDPDSDDSSSHDGHEDIDLISLRVASNGTSWNLNMGVQFRDAGIEAGDHVEFDFVWDEDGAMLRLGKIPSSEADDSPRARKVTDRGDTLSVKPPKDYLEDDPTFGLGLDIDHYDNDNPLLLEALVAEESIALFPVGFADDLEQEGEEDAPDSSEQASGDVDDERRGHPVAPEAVATAAQLTGVDEADVDAALEAIADVVSVEDVERVEEFELLEADDRVVAVVDREAWARIAEEVGLEDAVAEAARMAHTQQGEDLAVEHGGSEFRRFSRRYSAVVFLAPPS